MLSTVYVFLKRLLPLSLILFLLTGAPLLAQTQESVLFSILIKNGHVIDPKNGIDGIGDVDINDGKIVMVAENINGRATQVVDASGMYVVPGLIDIYWTMGDTHPDAITFRNGVTTVVNGSGITWQNFPEYKRNIIDRSQTRVMAFLQLRGDGYEGGPGEINSGDTE